MLLIPTKLASTVLLLVLAVASARPLPLHSDALKIRESVDSSPRKLNSFSKVDGALVARSELVKTIRRKVSSHSLRKEASIPKKSNGKRVNWPDQPTDKKSAKGGSLAVVHVYEEDESDEGGAEEDGGNPGDAKEDGGKQGGAKGDTNTLIAKPNLSDKRSKWSVFKDKIKGKQQKQQQAVGGGGDDDDQEQDEEKRKKQMKERVKLRQARWEEVETEQSLSNEAKKAKRKYRAKTNNFAWWASSP